MAVVGLAVLAVGIGASGGAGSTIRPGLAYVTGSAGSAPQVWLAAADGSRRRRLGSGTEPVLSPDGSLVAASTSSSRGSALTLYSASARVLRRFFGGANATAVAQAFSPDSHYLAVVLSSTDPGSDASSGLAVVETKSLSHRIVAHGPIDGASFAPDGSDRIVYASAARLALSARVDVHVVGADGSGRVQLTHDGRSLNPVWGGAAIAFDRELLRSGAAPAYQVWLMRPDGTRRTQLTHLRVPPLLDGLVPIGFSQDGSRLLAEYEGQDTSQAWALTVATRHTRKLEVDGHSVAGASISRSGAAVLVDRGGFLNPPDSGVIESVPFTGGRATPLVAHGAQPSWNL